MLVGLINNYLVEILFINIRATKALLLLLVSLALTACDGWIIAKNTAPIATAENTDTKITLEGTDADSDTLTYKDVSTPSYSSLSGTVPNLTYIPNPNFNGADSFTFKVNDGKVDSENATISIIVTSVNVAPTITGKPDTSVAEDSPYSFTPSGADNDGDTPLTYSISNKPDWASFITTTGKLSGTPTNTHIGKTENIVISVTDGKSTAVSLAAFDIEVTNTNDAPTITTTATTTAKEDTAYTYTRCRYG